ncbi:HNH endonuclease [Bradyrhizobium elkanii]|uniref:HNH endonuclease n=1 Tax=Bradyrhizobium elkanii TaxID=29448 RepID=UPI00272B55DA|nr:HNH endonuclease signature motif containing protein [Bradyrhizobium elkanii]WLA81958.1 HNH endonuclease signature motif containing protein [Bradyrhizobium elkanii]
MEEIDPKEGEFFEGVLLETFRDGQVTRPRVRPVEGLPSWLKVEFPRHLREENPIGTRFRADVHVRRKHRGDGSPNGPPYLRAENDSIFRVQRPNTKKLVFARQQPGTISGRAYEYYSIKGLPQSAAERFTALRRRAYENIIDDVPSKIIEAMRRERSRLMAEYAFARSNGTCEGCLKPAPFIRRNGQPYLEIHHLVALAADGNDHPANVVAICPNCHARITHGTDGKQFNSEIKTRIVQIESELDGE